jgi:hypothetical protein
VSDIKFVSGYKKKKNIPNNPENWLITEFTPEDSVSTEE